MSAGCKTSKPKDELTKRDDEKYAFKEVFHSAMQEKMRDNYDIAEQLFIKALAMQPENDAVHFALSDCYEKLGDKNKSLEYAVKAYELDNANKWYQLRCADLYFAAGNYHKAASFYKISIEDERSLDIKFKYAESLIYSAQYKLAIEILDEVEVEVGVSPNLSLTKHDLYLELGDQESAVQEMKKLIESDPNNIDNRLVVADYFLRTNQMDKAEKMIAETLEMAPQNGEVRLILADIAIRKGDLTTCFEHLEIGFKSEDVSLSQKMRLIGNLQQYAFEDSEDGHAIKDGLFNLYDIIYDDSIKNDTLHAQYGYFLDGIGKPLQAIEQFELVVGINPKYYDNWMTLIYAQMDIKDFDGMFETSKKAVELFPAQPTIFLMGGMAAIEVEAFDQAEEWLYYGKGLVVKNPSLEAEFQHQLGVLSWKQEDYEQAHTYFNQAKEIDNYNGNVYESKALCLVDQGKNEEALAEAQDAVDQAPTNAFFLNLKALILFKTGDLEDAQKTVENALVYEPRNPMILENYGDILFQSGKEEKALEQWQKAIDNGGYNAVLDRKLNDKKYYEE
mgnify:CR=1 FL=1